MARYENICLGPADKSVSMQSVDALASAAIAPGSVCVLNSSGQFAVHGDDGDGAGVQLYAANYNYFQGLQADDNNPSGDTMEGLRIFDDGVFALLVGNGQNITARDTPMTSAGNGTLRIGVVGTDDILFYAEEVFNNNTGSNQLVQMRRA